MAIRDEDFSADLAVEGDDGIWSPSAAVSSSVSLDFRSLYRQAHARADRERARADAAEARAEELLRAEQTSRSDAGSWKWRFKACRSRLTAVEAEVKEQRRAAKDVPSLQAEIAGLKTLLSEAGISLSADGVIASLRTEVARLRKALAASEAGKSAPGRRPGKARGVGSASKVTQQQKEKIKSLRAECGGLRRDVTRLNKKLEQETQRAEGLKATGKKLSGEVIELHAELRRRRDQTGLGLLADRRGLLVAPFGEGCRRQGGDLEGPGGQGLGGVESPQGGVVRRRRRFAQGPAEVASPEGRDQVVGQEERPAAQGREDVAGPDRGAEGAGLQASREPGDAVPGGCSARRARSRRSRPLGASAASSAAHPAMAAPSGPTSRSGGKRRPRPGTRSSVPVAASPTRRTARRRPPSSRSRSRLTSAGSSRPPLASGLRVRVLAPGGDRASGATSVRPHALRDQRLGALLVRALRLLPPAQAGRGMDVRPGALDLAGHAGQQRRALHPRVRARGGRDPRSPEPTDGPSRRRDQLAYPIAARDRPVEPRLAMELGQRRCGLLPLRPLALGRGREDLVRRDRRNRVRGL